MAAIGRRRGIRAGLGFLLACSAALVLTEAGARVITAWTANPDLRMTIEDYRNFEARAATIRFEPDADLGYRLKPHFRWTGPSGGETRHNAQGYRANADFGPKPAGAFRIVCLGGSTTYGTGVEANGETYPARLETLLQSASGNGGAEPRVEVFNLGVGGYTSLEVLGALRRDALPLEPDAVLIQLAINDAAPRFYPDFDCSYGHFRVPMQALPEGAAARLLPRSRAVLLAGWAMGWYRPLTLQARTQRPLPGGPDAAHANLAINGPHCFESNLREAVALCAARGIAVYLLTQPYFSRPAPPGTDEAALRLEEAHRLGQREHNTVLMAVAASTGARLIDLNQLTPRAAELFADPIHMTAEGNRVKAELIAASLMDR